MALQCLILNHQALRVQGAQPMLGASLSWAVSKDFRLEHGEPHQGRTVVVTVRSAFKMASTCNYTLGERVSCNVPTESLNATSCQDAGADGLCDGDLRRRQARAVRAEHGVLCVGQVVETSAGTLDLIHTTGDTDVHVACASDASRVWKTRHPNGSHTIVAAASGAPQDEVGKVNSFHVTALHTQEDPFAVDRRIQGLEVAVGVLVHTVHVRAEAIALVAWLAHAGREDGPAQTDLLLPRCSDAPDERSGNDAGEPCSMNAQDADLSSGGGAGGEGDDTLMPSSASSEFWQGLVIPGVPLRAFLKTYVPLCCVTSHCRGSEGEMQEAGEQGDTQNDGNVSQQQASRNLSCSASLSAQGEDSFNYHSPVPEFPLLVQVQASSDPLVPHPRAPWLFGTYDPDGHAMTDIFPLLTTSQGTPQQNVRCYFGATGAGPGAQEEWPTRLCLPVSSRGAGAVSSDDGLTCESDDDCSLVLTAGGGGVGGEGGGGGLRPK